MAVLQKIDNPYGMIQTVEHCESFSIYRSQDSTGDCEVTVYPVFSGIELVYYDVHMQSCDINLAKGREMLIITHCQEGRIEFEYKNGEYLYLASGDLSIQKNTENIRHRYCPLSHYHGVSVAIDMNRVPRCFSCILDDVFVSPEELEMKFCSEKPYSIMRENISIEHIFSELYSVPENIRKGYHKVKVLELLLFLSALDVAHEKHGYTAAQVRLARAARDALLHTMACKAAIKGGWVSDPAELRVLVDRVQSGEIKYCPHGRPVAIELTRKDLEKQFRRA